MLALAEEDDGQFGSDEDDSEDSMISIEQLIREHDEADETFLEHQIAEDVQDQRDTDVGVVVVDALVAKKTTNCFVIIYSYLHCWLKNDFYYLYYMPVKLYMGQQPHKYFFVKMQ